GFVDPGLLGDGDDAWAHDVARGLAFLGEDVRLGDDADDMAFTRDDGRAGDALRQERARDLIDGRVLAERDHVSCHHFLDRNHFLSRSVATVWRLAFPPLSTSPVRPAGSLSERYAASGSAPV